MARVKIYLNRQKDADDRLAIFSRMGGSAYRDGDALELVYEYGVDYETGADAVEYGCVLDTAFSDFNRGSPTFVGDDAYSQRSLSAGDVVEVEGLRFACELSGWRQLPEVVA